MTEAAISRAFVSDIEIRADGSGRTVHGIVVPFDRTARVSDGGPSYMEGFRKGAFTRTIQHRGDRVKLLSQHDMRRNPLGRATMLREDASGLYGEFHVSKTAAGDEALELLRDGALDSFSVGFSPIQHVRDNEKTVWRTEVGLREASLVTFPAYEGALIGGVRALTPDDLAELAQMLRQSVDLAATPIPDPAADGTSTLVEPARTADEDPAEGHSALHNHTRNRAKARREGGPLS
jgi:HK97 family phage prohead protease